LAVKIFGGADPAPHVGGGSVARSRRWQTSPCVPIQKKNRTKIEISKKFISPSSANSTTHAKKSSDSERENGGARTDFGIACFLFSRHRDFCESFRRSGKTQRCSCPRNTAVKIAREIKIAFVGSVPSQRQQKQKKKKEFQSKYNF
jgi:hypothetical protein